MRIVYELWKGLQSDVDDIWFIYAVVQSTVVSLVFLHMIVGGKTPAITSAQAGLDILSAVLTWFLFERTRVAQVFFTLVFVLLAVALAQDALR